MFKAYFDCIKKYAVFRGRARRREYWLFVLCNCLISAVFAGAASTFWLAQEKTWYEICGLLTAVYAVFALLPGLAVAVRRLHDTGRGGGYLFIGLIPVVGFILLLVAMCRDSEPGENKYGLSAKEASENGSRTVQAGRTESVFSQDAIPTNKVSKKPMETAIVSKTLIAVCTDGPNAGKGAKGEVIYIGRDPSLCQLTLPDTAGVSKVHCMLHAGSDGIEVRDLGSTYGTFLRDGKKLEANTSIFLPDGGTICLGSPKTTVVVEFV